MYLVTAAEMQAMDRITIDAFGIPGRVLMETAGREATRVFLAHFSEAARRGVAIAAGRGNNGGDGHV
ncbi:MAG: yjeF, partial [Deltaproteobacteria bacterium]|nr:yjeF [Deltaproteobacteria bacterium]